MPLFTCWKWKGEMSRKRQQLQQGEPFVDRFLIWILRQVLCFSPNETSVIWMNQRRINNQQSAVSSEKRTSHLERGTNNKLISNHLQSDGKILFCHLFSSYSYEGIIGREERISLSKTLSPSHLPNFDSQKGSPFQQRERIPLSHLVSWNPLSHSHIWILMMELCDSLPFLPLFLSCH